MFRILKLVLSCAVIVPAYSQVSPISHFVSPSYPPLARQAGISGQTTLALKVSREGTVRVAAEESSTHPLLTQEAKRCVEAWSFAPGTRERTMSVTLYFGLTGAPVDTNATATVTADFAGSSVRVYVTSNPAPMVRP